MTYSELYQTARRILQESGNDAAVHEARCLMQELMGIDRIRLIADGGRIVPAEQEQRLIKAAERRAGGYPLQYLLGCWTFMGREFAVGEGVLIPRDDTEVAVMTCREALRDCPKARIADLCSGSGIIAVTLAGMLPQAEVTALELQEAAFGYLQKNIAMNGCTNVKALQGDLFTAHTLFADGSLDAIISNPPYIAREVLPTLQKEVQFEPAAALDGGDDGLDFYRCLASDWTAKLRKGGSMTLEIGEEQAADVMALLSAHGMGELRAVQDIQGLDRVIFGTKI